MVCEAKDIKRYYNFEEAKIEFFDFFIHDFLNWMETPTSELSDEAKELKSKYLEYVDYK